MQKPLGLPNHDFLNIMFGGTVATEKNVFCMSSQILKETTEGSGDFADSTEFVDPQCEPFVNVDAMEIEGPSSSRVGPAVTKGKGKKCSIARKMYNSLKSISDALTTDGTLLPYFTAYKVESGGSFSRCGTLRRKWLQASY